ncbi:hypothetical protein M513_14289 [Trichuris suis]|uniref:Helix-turn-helix domain-containing protein n=1 Tax=Trichuris suis TaxID=68888 RepID=A0A085LIN8_9BILA|nr:hypothetical protein M513_14289 [Trichuris suis]
MESLERKAFEMIDTGIAPRLFKRYVDDIFAIIKKEKEEQFLNFLNSIFPEQIVFTMEKEENEALPFLDVLIVRTKEGLKIKVHRKPTDTDQYLHFLSHHPRSVMRGILCGMVDRAVSLCSPEFLESELNYISTTFSKNG